MIIKQDLDAWQFGFSDGKDGHKKNKSQAVDGLAYSSGWIEGDAYRQKYLHAGDIKLADLPEEEREPFFQYLVENGQTIPEPGWAFKSDYERWKSGHDVWF